MGGVFYIFFSKQRIIKGFYNKTVGKKSDKILPSPVANMISRYCGHLVVDVVTGSGCCFLVTKQGQLYVRGSNTKGQLGLRKEVEDQKSFIRLKLPQRIKTVVTKFNTTFVITIKGEVWHCGVQFYQRMECRGKERCQFGFTKLQFPEGIKIADIVVGYYHAIFIPSSSSPVFGYGANHFSQVTSKIKENYLLQPTEVSLPSVCLSDKVVSIDVHFYYTLVVNYNGRVFKVGHSDYIGEWKLDPIFLFGGNQLIIPDNDIIKFKQVKMSGPSTFDFPFFLTQDGCLYIKTKKSNIFDKLGKITKKINDILCASDDRLIVLTKDGEIHYCYDSNQLYDENSDSDSDSDDQNFVLSPSLGINFNKFEGGVIKYVFDYPGGETCRAILLTRKDFLYQLNCDIKIRNRSVTVSAKVKLLPLSEARVCSKGADDDLEDSDDNNFSPKF